MKVQESDGGRDGRSLVKKKWDDTVYFLAQDRCMEDMELRPNRAVFRLAVMGFVRTTCSRAGSFAKDWFDRAGKAARWVGCNICTLSTIIVYTTAFVGMSGITLYNIIR